MIAPKSDPFWWEDFAPDTGQLPELPAECEVVIVGAGLTGCSAARTLAGSGTDVVVLDAQTPGFGASTRNGGMTGGGYRLSLEQMTERYGSETAHALLRESHIDSLAFATSLIEDEAITCDYHTYGRFRGLWNKAEYDATARSLDQLRELLPVNIEMIPPGTGFPVVADHHNVLPLSIFPADKRVPFVTSSTCTATAERAADLAARTNGAVESMEGAAIVHVALLEGMAVGEIRGISNMVGPRDRGAWQIKEAAHAAQEALLQWLES